MSWQEVYASRLLRKRYADALRANFNAAAYTFAEELGVTIEPVKHFLEIDDVDLAASLVEIELAPVINVTTDPFFRLGPEDTSRQATREESLSAAVIAPGVDVDHISAELWEQDVEERQAALDRADVYLAALIEVGRKHLPCGGSAAIRVDLREGARLLRPNLLTAGERIESRVTWITLAQTLIEE